MNFQLSLEIGSFVAFLSAELGITGGEEPSVSLSIADCDSVYNGTMDAASADRLHQLIVSALRTYGRDESWHRCGLDGTTYRGSFRSAALSVEEFEFWSPDPGTPPHWLVSAAIESVPLHHDDRPEFELALELLRQALGMGVPLRWTWGDPPCLRILGSVPALSHWRSALSLVPETGDFVIDLSNLHSIPSVPQDYVSDLKGLVSRRPPIKWLLGHGNHLDWLLEVLAIPRECIVKRT